MCESFDGGPPAKYIWFGIHRVRIHRLILTLSLMIQRWRLKNCRNRSWHVGPPQPSISFPLALLCHGLSLVWFFETPGTVAHQASLSMRILQARILDRVAVSSSRAPSPPRDQILSCLGRRILDLLSHRGSPSMKLPSIKYDQRFYRWRSRNLLCKNNLPATLC